MRSYVLGVVLCASVVAGCAPNNTELLNEVAAFETRACGCKDAACVDGVVGDVKVWFDKYKDRLGTQSDLDEVERRFTRMGECMGRTGMSEKSEKLLLEIAKEADKM